MKTARAAGVDGGGAPPAARRLTAALLCVALAVAAAMALLWAAQRPRFDFRRIEVVGELRHLGKAQVRAALSGRLAGTFFTMRLRDARAALESIPWVAAASARRVWPDRLVLEVVERRALGVWNDGRVLGDDGQLFDGNPAEADLDGRIVEFSGPPRFAGEAVEKLRGFDLALSSLRTSVAAVGISDRASWTVRTAAGQTIDLGRDEPPGSVQARLTAVVASYPSVLARLGGPPDRIDARYNNGFAAAP
jgi:cell division protein FtsQ